MERPLITLEIRYENELTSAESGVTYDLQDQAGAKQMAHAMVDEWFENAAMAYSNHILITSSEKEYWSDIETDMLGQPGVFDCRKLTLAQQRMVESFINHVVKVRVVD